MVACVVLYQCFQIRKRFIYLVLIFPFNINIIIAINVCGCFTIILPRMFQGKEIFEFLFWNFSRKVWRTFCTLFLLCLSRLAVYFSVPWTSPGSQSGSWAAAGAFAVPMSLCQLSCSCVRGRLQCWTGRMAAWAPVGRPCSWILCMFCSPWVHSELWLCCLIFCFAYKTFKRCPEPVYLVIQWKVITINPN